MKRFITSGIIFMLAIVSLMAAEKDDKKTRVENDTLDYIEVSGKIVDNQTEEPVVFATVFINETSIATVSNGDGDFVLKVPKSMQAVQLSFMHLGYTNSSIGIEALMEEDLVIKLSPVTLPIDEVVVRSIDPQALILKALEEVKNNYSSTSEMQTSFYREAIKQNRNYVAISEAVMDIYKAPYKGTFTSDRMKIYKGRKSSDVKKMDTLIVKLQGGPITSLMLDVVKNPGELLGPEVLEMYDFELTGVISIDNRETYVIKFDQKDGVKYPLYKGSIYIDSESNAFAGFDFGLSEKGIPYASKYLVKKKPSSLKVEVERGHYLVRYRNDNGVWYLNYVRSELDFNAKSKKQLFKSNISVMLEMAVTDRVLENVEKFDYKESARLNDVFSEQVSFLDDIDFWGDYNTIKPNESIEVAINKLNKKLKRRQ